MVTYLAYCAALDRDVRVSVRPVRYDETEPTAGEPPGVECRDHAEECLGIRCPLFQGGPTCRLELYARLSRDPRFRL